MKLLLFDIDQTLINTGGAGLRGLNRACRKLFGLEGAMDGISPHGKTDPAIVREILSRKLGSQTPTNADIATVLDSYISFLKEEVYTSTTYRVLPGVQSLLDQIVARGDVLVGLATGNIELGARIKAQYALLVTDTPEQFDRQIRDETAHLTEVFRDVTN